MSSGGRPLEEDPPPAAASGSPGAMHSGCAEPGIDPRTGESAVIDELACCSKFARVFRGLVSASASDVCTFLNRTDARLNAGGTTVLGAIFSELISSAEEVELNYTRNALSATDRYGQKMDAYAIEETRKFFRSVRSQLDASQGTHTHTTAQVPTPEGQGSPVYSGGPVSGGGMQGTSAPAAMPGRSIVASGFVNAPPGTEEGRVDRVGMDGADALVASGNASSAGMESFRQPSTPRSTVVASGLVGLPLELPPAGSAGQGMPGRSVIASEIVGGPSGFAELHSAGSGIPHVLSHDGRALPTSAKSTPGSNHGASGSAVRMPMEDPQNVSPGVIHLSSDSESPASKIPGMIPGQIVCSGVVGGAVENGSDGRLGFASVPHMGGFVGSPPDDSESVFRTAGRGNRSSRRAGGRSFFRGRDNRSEADRTGFNELPENDLVRTASASAGSAHALGIQPRRVQSGPSTQHLVSSSSESSDFYSELEKETDISQAQVRKIRRLRNSHAMRVFRAFRNHIVHASDTSAVAESLVGFNKIRIHAADVFHSKRDLLTNLIVGLLHEQQTSTRLSARDVHKRMRDDLRALRVSPDVRDSDTSALLEVINVFVFDNGFRTSFLLRQAEKVRLSNDTWRDEAVQKRRRM